MISDQPTKTLADLQLANAPKESAKPAPNLADTVEDEEQIDGRLSSAGAQQSGSYVDGPDVSAAGRSAEALLSSG
jgi:hypothetical protein